MMSGRDESRPTAAPPRDSIMPALYLGLTDIFVTATGIMVLVIVMMSSSQGRPQYWPADFRVICPSAEQTAWILTDQDGEEIARTPEPDALLGHLPDHRLHVNVVVSAPPDRLACVARFRAVVTSYHTGLGQRDARVGPIVAVEWVPEPTTEVQ